MRNYHTIDETTCNDQSITITKAVNPWQYCIANYKANVEADTSFTEQTTEEEISAYIMSLPKQNISLDTVKFWEVCQCCLLYHHLYNNPWLLVFYRPITLHSQQFTVWLWITFPFKLLPYLVNKFSPPALKLTQKNATESNRSSLKPFRSSSSASRTSDCLSLRTSSHLKNPWLELTLPSETGTYWLVFLTSYFLCVAFHFSWFSLSDFNSPFCSWSTSIACIMVYSTYIMIEYDICDDFV